MNLNESIFPATLPPINPYWLSRGLVALYVFRPDIWKINLVTKKVGATIVGTSTLPTVGPNFVRTYNDATKYINLNLNGFTTFPGTILAGCHKISGSVVWSVLDASKSTWFGVYGGADAGINTVTNNVFDGALAGTAVKNMVCSAIAMVGTNNLRGSFDGGLVLVDSAVTLPTGTNYTTAALGVSGRLIPDNQSLSDITHFAVFKTTLTDAELRMLSGDPSLLFMKPKNLRTIGFPLIGIDAVSNSGYQAAASSYSWNHTCTGNNRYLVVGISMLSLAQTVSGITYNGVAMTFLGAQNSVSGAARVELWGLIAPATGTNSIAVTLTGAIASAGNASSYTNVHQTSPTESFNSAQATNVGAADATVDVTTVAAFDMVVDCLATDDATVTVGAGQTQTGNVTGAGGSGAMSYEGLKNPAGAVTMSWT